MSSGQSISELFVSLGVNVEGLEDLQKFNRALNGIVANFKVIKESVADNTKIQKDSNEQVASSTANNNRLSANTIASLIYIGKTVYNTTRKMLSYALSLSTVSFELLKLNTNLGLSTQRLQAMGFEAQGLGVKFSDFTGAVSGLRRLSSDIALGRGDISPFALLGIDPHQDPEAVLVQLQSRLSQLPRAIGTALASDLGLSENMINFVRKADFTKLASRPRLTSGEIEELDSLRTSALQFMNTFSVITQRVFTMISPLIRSFLDLFTEFFSNNGMLGLVSLFMRMMGVNDTLGQTYTALEKIKVIIAEIMGLFSLGTMLVNPALGGVMLLIEGIALIIEDLVKGGKGLQFLFLTMKYLIFDIVESIYNGIINAFSNMISNFKLLFENPMQFIKNFKGTFESLNLTPDISGRTYTQNGETRIVGDFTFRDSEGKKLNVQTNSLNLSTTETSLAGVK